MPIVHAGLVGLGLPVRSVSSGHKEAKPAREQKQDAELAGAMLDIAFGEGSATERLIRMTLARC